MFEEEKLRKIKINNLILNIMGVVRSEFTNNFDILVSIPITIDNKEFRRVCLVSNLNDFQLRLNDLKKSRNFPYNLEKENLEILFTLNGNPVVELLK